MASIIFSLLFGLGELSKVLVEEEISFSDLIVILQADSFSLVFFIFAVSLLILLFCILFIIYAGQGKSNTLRKVLILLWTFILLNIVTTVYIDISTDGLFGETIKPIIKNIIFGGIWTLYFLHSKRVKKTYVIEA